MLKKLLLVMSIFSLSFAMEEGDDLGTVASPQMNIADYADAWRHIARFLPGNNEFLNIYIARTIPLDMQTRNKIIKSFLRSVAEMEKNLQQSIKSLEEMEVQANSLADYKRNALMKAAIVLARQKIVDCRMSFYRTNLLSKEADSLIKYYNKDTDYIDHLIKCEIDECADCRKFEAREATNKKLKKAEYRTHRRAERCEGLFLGATMLFGPPVVMSIIFALANINSILASLNDYAFLE